MMVGILNFVYVVALRQTTISTQNMLYRYIVTGNYENAPVDYMGLLTPSVIASVTGLALCICYVVKKQQKIKVITEERLMQPISFLPHNPIIL